jgi:ABC-type glycerol-3-phosphate transport system substrate-binding protein
MKKEFFYKIILCMIVYVVGNNLGSRDVIGSAEKVLRVWTTEVNPVTVAVMNEIGAQLTAKHPDVKVQVEALGWGDLNTKLFAAIAAGDPPDLTELQPYATASLYQKGLLRPMDDVVQAIGEEDITPLVRKLQYFDGHYYGIAHVIGSNIFIYRKDLFDKKGIKVPTTWSELAEAAKRLTEDLDGDGKIDLYGITLPGERLYMGFILPAEWLASNGGRWVDPETWRPAFTEKPFIEMLYFVQELNKYCPPGWSGRGYLDTMAQFASGKIAIVIMAGARTIGFIEKYAPKEMQSPDYFVAEVKQVGPSGKIGITPLDGENWAIFKDSKYGDLAAEYLKLYYQKDNYIKLLHTVPIHLSPILMSIAKSPEYLNNPTIQKWSQWQGIVQKIFDEKLASPIGMVSENDNVIPFLAELDGSGIVADMIQRVAAGGKPEEEAIKAQKMAEDLIEQLGYKKW